MAQYRGTLQGNRGEVSRLGHKSTGLLVKACGWHVGGAAEMAWDEHHERDAVSLCFNGGSNSRCGYEVLQVFRSPVGDLVGSPSHYGLKQLIGGIVHMEEGPEKQRLRSEWLQVAEMVNGHLNFCGSPVS